VKKTEKKEAKSMKKLTLIIIPVIIIICVVGLVLFMWSTSNAGAANAQLVIESGDVQVKHTGGSWATAENGMLLSQSDSVMTGTDSSASIILFESSIVRLDSNTEVSLQQIIKESGETSVTINQEVGKTWNTVQKISGIDNYDVQTPSTVASVRGTAFVVIVMENGSTYYGVSHGILNVSSVSNGTIQDFIDVSGNESVIIYVDMVGGTLEIKPFEMDEWVLENLLLDDQLLIDVETELFSRIEPYIPELKEVYGINDEELEALIEGYVLGYYDLPPETPDWVRDLIELA